MLKNIRETQNQGKIHIPTRHLVYDFFYYIGAYLIWTGNASAVMIFTELNANRKIIDQTKSNTRIGISSLRNQHAIDIKLQHSIAATVKKENNGISSCWREIISINKCNTLWLLKNNMGLHQREFMNNNQEQFFMALIKGTFEENFLMKIVVSSVILICF